MSYVSQPAGLDVPQELVSLEFHLSQESAPFIGTRTDIFVCH